MMATSSTSSQWDPAEVRDNPVKIDQNGMLDPTPWGNWVAISKRNARDSPLLRIPAELRHQIFTYALDGFTTCIRPRNSLIQCYGKLGLYQALKDRDRTPSSFGLLQTCRQIYAETALMPITLTTFCPFPNVYPLPSENGRGELTQYQFDNIAIVSYSFAILDGGAELRIRKVGKYLENMPGIKKLILEVVPYPYHLYSDGKSSFPLDPDLGSEITTRLKEWMWHKMNEIKNYIEVESGHSVDEVIIHETLVSWIGFGYNAWPYSIYRIQKDSDSKQ